MVDEEPELKRVPLPFVAVITLTDSIDDISRAKRAMNQVLRDKDHLNEKQTEAIADEINKVIDKLKLALKYIKGEM